VVWREKIKRECRKSEKKQKRGQKDIQKKLPVPDSKVPAEGESVGTYTQTRGLSFTDGRFQQTMWNHTITNF
jgi:hypothetical protein